MDTLFLKQERMLAQTSTDIVRELMNKIHWIIISLLII